MISNNAEFDQFVTDHRWAVLTTVRDGQPVSSMVAYARDGDRLVVSTPGRTFKRSSVEKDARVNLCVISNQEPFNFVAIEGEAVVTRENLEADTIKVFDNIADTGYQLPEDLPHWLESQQRVIISITPVRVHGVIR